MAVDGWIAVVLAAGQGRRMGGPKALMEIGGRPWWAVQQERLAGAGVAALWVVSDPVFREMVNAQEPPARGLVADSAAPMFNSIRRGIEAARPHASHGIFILPVDVPAPRDATWEALAAAAGDRVAVPTFGGEHGHPVALSAAWLDRSFPSAPDAGDRLDDLIEGHVSYLAVDDPTVVVNLNTPDDVAAWLAR
jgi:CTP:molybdopterin cytidylyltransferase MocA